jgi:hypothetical protein
MSDATAPEKDPRFNYTERKKQEGDAFQKEFRSQKEQAVTPSPDQRAFTSDSETPTENRDVVSRRDYEEKCSQLQAANADKEHLALELAASLARETKFKMEK